MANSLIPSEGQTLSTLLAQDQPDLLRPFLQEIYLDSVYISGLLRIPDPSVLESLKPEEEVFLCRRVKDSSDSADSSVPSSAMVVIRSESGRLLGWIADRQSRVYGNLLDAGKKLKAKVELCEERLHFPAVRIGIYLVDY